MRALLASGWINFRMRAMLLSFASHHLWIDWRDSGLHLARLFVDYEPGIHWSQCQMQSGTTGINTIRIYNPIKQGLDHDPEGEFLEHWLPELAGVPAIWRHEPWRMDPATQEACGCRIGRDYPAPIVEVAAAAREARERLWGLRRQPGFGAAADAIQERHGSRRSGLPSSGKRGGPRRRRVADGQLCLDLGLPPEDSSRSVT
jgi:deoxyribodipyrimidine photo-lyase